MQLPSALSFLIDEAIDLSEGDVFLTTLAERLIADGVPLIGAMLTQAAPHPVIERRAWLWRSDTGKVIEALGFGPPMAEPGHGEMAVEWLNGLGARAVRIDQVGSLPDAAQLGWATSRSLDDGELALLADVARFAATPLALLAARSALSGLLTAYLGRRSAGQVLDGRLRRGPGQTITAAVLFADLRGFTELSETGAANEVITALDAWFDRIAGAVHAFGGEVLKFIGDGVLAIFPIGERNAAAACDAALRAVSAACAGMEHLNRTRATQDLPLLSFGAALHLGDMLWGNIGTADRLDFTAIGPAVNLVSRLEGLCRPLGRTVLLSGAFAAETTQPLVPLGEHKLRGIAMPCQVFTLP
ncbi:adenylate/guanylate cyclase domain-containing protein [Phyllobacterium sp. 0TCS1.6C]|uniref:adenylate/guanylate cyclase domain-containing protein n=1 Tax=unclassified Phyllobacterium TaxID=2638441 RepID=UPI0022651831|nr:MULTISPECIES: adenylate/guanylate cyclase domain-containing protein [unclassified Phyllobacterium]MCX8282131.1 adenylate/guanylate cyclase domain-containing protein [Phyllobacterium sp. 0TCS1.6C]MCX8296339.1 adenylate/guanylate cyclase domain-containing protein [Phyllobacterium sp. 0TCS1.6A]